MRDVMPQECHNHSHIGLRRRCADECTNTEPAKESRTLFYKRTTERLSLTKTVVRGEEEDAGGR
jgi:hypothetical protein